MNTIDLKIFTMFYINEHDNLTKKEKLELMLFVREASKEQVGYLLITGEVQNKLTESHLRTLNEGITGTAWRALGVTPISKDPVTSIYTFGMSHGFKLGMGAAALAALAGVIGYKVYQAYLSKAARACKGKSGPAKTDCMVKFKKAGVMKRIEAMKKVEANCSKTKDPEKCKFKIARQIAKAKAKMGEL